MESWKGKIVLITGAASGIGEGVVRLMLERGVKHVAVLDVAEDCGRALENELNTKYGPNSVKFYKCDVTDEELFLELFDTVKNEQGYLDVVINNAAIMNDSYKSYKKQIDINVTALVTGTLKAIEIMGKQNGGKGGTVLNISSVAALCQSHLFPIYFGTKSAVLQFSNCIGLEEHYAKSGVRVLSICFGATDTPLLSGTKLGSFDEEIDDTCADFIKKKYLLQKMESAAKGLVEAYEHAKSGETWIITKNKPAKNITDTVKKAYELLSDHGLEAVILIIIILLSVQSLINKLNKPTIVIFQADNYYSRTGVRVLTMCFGATDTSLIAIENMGSFDEVVEIRLCEPLKLYPGQKIESAARAVIDAYKQGSSGSIWLSYANKAAEDITQVDTEAYKLLTATVLNSQQVRAGPASGPMPGHHLHNLDGRLRLILGTHTLLRATPEGKTGAGRDRIPPTGVFIAILDTDVEAGEMLQDKMMTEYGNSKVKFIQCDVTVDEELFGAFDDVVKEIGYIDLVINNAGIANESDPKAIRKEVEVNYIALVNGTLKSLELMRKDKGGNGGTIVNISSIGCMCQHAPALFVYMGTKSAVLQFSNCIGREEYYSKTGVRILTVCFGITKTGIYNNLKSFDENINKDMQQIIDLYPMQSKESAAKGAIEAIKKGESGSTWLVAKDSPAVDVTSNVNKAYKILSEPLV
ncbi:uncharacterized protein LOC101746362 [Bombyx mori]|uniref:uncharacterized protein LOC101746362 n=1 Tax=Bombyx mori TaxID=7091 RepID=UPI002ED15EA9